MKAALDCLSALAQPTRLAVFRMLVAAGPDGIAAGGIAQRLGVPPATLSFHLKELEASGLLVSRRKSRQILYAAEYARMSAMLVFLTEDCCGGRPEICRSLADRLATSPGSGRTRRAAARRRDTIVSQAGGRTGARAGAAGTRRAATGGGER